MLRWQTAILIGCWCVLAQWAGAELYNSYVLVDGRIISGRPTGQYKDEFVQLKLETGGYSNYAWGLFSTDSLRELAKDKKAAPRASVFLDEPAPMRPPKAEKKDKGPSATWTPKPVERMERPAHGSLAGSPVMVCLMVLMYLANLYAGYAVSLFRHQPLLMVCGLSALLPGIVPVVFLALPTREPEEEEEETEAVAEPAAEAVVGAEAAAAAGPAQPAAPTGPTLPPTVIYQRGQTTFNRRFFETKFAGFMKVVPGEAEKDMFITIESARGTHTGQRLTRIQPNDLVLHVVKGTASEEVTIPYGEITLITVKHKDAPE